eukprot:CAMPEP_0197075746 /NCGR_PEP_ID=MMETSP1384-20130603/211767_1 /TAXON_ID=29189 /ORGANISM="Ammonia sp." /LENGTH=888 /DNA_ID=CAMNT_0042514595 /DNA_START=1 /DNA_END=2667 /DNA_ORIENTATION=-
MISQATEDRLAELQRMKSSTRGGRASIGPTNISAISDEQSKSKVSSNDKEYRYSLANTDTEHLKKIERQQREQHAKQRAQQTRQVLRWKKSQKDVLQNQPKTVDDEKQQPSEHQHKLSPVPQHTRDEDGDDILVDANPNKRAPPHKPAVVTKPPATATAAAPSAHSNTTKKAVSTTSTASAASYKMGATPSNMDLPCQNRTPHIINPCVPLPNFADDDKSNAKKHGQRRSSGLNKLGRFIFGKRHQHQNDDPMSCTPDSNRSDLNGLNSSSLKPPKRVFYELEDQKYELYSWLKPTKTLGQGAYATVIEVMDERTKFKYAIKKNRDVFNNVADARRILREIKLMIHMRHDNIIGLTGCIPPERWDINTFDEVYLIMPRCDTTLKRVIRSRQQLTEDHVVFFAYQMARGLEYMHSGNIIHRDLKPENILVNISNCRIQITDFGLARGVAVDVDTPQKLTEYVVTRWYRAPEVMCCKHFYEARIDVWSLGCIIAELYTRKPLWKGKHSRDQLSLIFETMGTPRNTHWISSISQKQWIEQLPRIPPKDLSKLLPGSSRMAVDFIRHILVLNPAERPTISQVIEHAFLASRRKQRHKKECPKFNISFEYEQKIKTNFGVRHMMYEELSLFHRRIMEYEKALMTPNKVVYDSFNLCYPFHAGEVYQLLITGYINQISNAYQQFLVPHNIAKCICLFSNLCVRWHENHDAERAHFKLSGQWNSCIARVKHAQNGSDGPLEWKNIYSLQELSCDAVYVFKLKVKKINFQHTHNVIEIGLVNTCLFKYGNTLSKSFRDEEYRSKSYGKQIRINDIDEIIEVIIDFGYDENNGLLSIHRYPDSTLTVSNLKYSCMIAKHSTATNGHRLNMYKFAIAMKQTGLAVELFHFFQHDLCVT